MSLVKVFQNTLKNLAPVSSPNVQTNAAKKLSERLLGKFSRHFSLSVDPRLSHDGKDTFKVHSNYKKSARSRIF